MADENDTNTIVETVSPEVVAEPKKQRATRRPKVAAESAPSAISVKSPKAPRQKRTEKVKVAVDAVDTQVAAKGAAKGVRKARAAVQPVASAQVPVLTSDGMADLLQLENENQALRKALAEKLRAENADLRKRLGQA